MPLPADMYQTKGEVLQDVPSGSHLLVAHMRADFVVLQPGRLFKQLKTI